MKNKKNLTKRREFLKKAGLISAGAIGASTLAAPYGYAATNPIKWSLIKQRMVKWRLNFFMQIN